MATSFIRAVCTEEVGADSALRSVLGDILHVVTLIAFRLHQRRHHSIGIAVAIVIVFNILFLPTNVLLYFSNTSMALATKNVVDNDFNVVLSEGLCVLYLVVLMNV